MVNELIEFSRINFLGERREAYPLERHAVAPQEGTFQFSLEPSAIP